MTLGTLILPELFKNYSLNRNSRLIRHAKYKIATWKKYKNNQKTKNGNKNSHGKL